MILFFAFFARDILVWVDSVLTSSPSRYARPTGT
jgi:hypothetical protein